MSCLIPLSGAAPVVSSANGISEFYEIQPVTRPTELIPYRDVMFCPRARRNHYQFRTQRFPTRQSLATDPHSSDGESFTIGGTRASEKAGRGCDCEGNAAREFSTAGG